MRSTKGADLIGHDKFSVVATSRWLQCDQTLPLSAKGVACETSRRDPIGESNYLSIVISPNSLPPSSLKTKVLVSTETVLLPR